MSNLNIRSFHNNSAQTTQSGNLQPEPTAHEDGTQSAHGTYISLPSFSLLIFAPPPYPLDPPSYTTIMRPGESRCPVPPLMDYLLGPSAPFIAPKPPPTYNEAIGIPLEPEIEDFVELPVPMNSSVLGITRTRLACPQCYQLVETETQSVTTKATHFSALILCLFGCCLLPYCIAYFKKTLHFCPICGYYFGFYSPLSRN